MAWLRYLVSVSYGASVKRRMVARLSLYVLRDVLWIEGCSTDIISSHAFVNDINEVRKYVLPKHGDPYLKLDGGVIVRLRAVDNISQISMV